MKDELAELMGEFIRCPNCSASTRLQFLPMLEGQVYAQCCCGYGWELQPVTVRKEWVN